MFKKKYDVTPRTPAYPPFINDVMEQTRQVAEQGGIVSVRMDNSAKTVVVFSIGNKYRIREPNARMVYLQVKKTENDNYLLIFAGTSITEDTPTREYTQEKFTDIAEAIIRYLRTGAINEQQ